MKFIYWIPPIILLSVLCFLIESDSFFSSSSAMAGEIGCIKSFARFKVPGYKIWLRCLGKAFYAVAGSSSVTNLFLSIIVEARSKDLKIMVYFWKCWSGDEASTGVDLNDPFKEFLLLLSISDDDGTFRWEELILGNVRVDSLFDRSILY